MNVATTRLGLNIILLTSLPIMAGCVAPPPTVSPHEIIHVSDTKGVFLSPPIVEYINSQTGRRIAQHNPNDGQLKSSLLAELRTGIAAQHVPVFQCSDVPELGTQIPKELVDVYRVIRTHASSLDTSQRQCLSAIAAKTNASHILFCRYHVHIAPGSTWNPWSGAITSNDSRIVLECHLYDIQSNHLVWMKTTQRRTKPADATSSAAAMVKALLATVQLEHS